MAVRGIDATDATVVPGAWPHGDHREKNRRSVRFSTRSSWPGSSRPAAIPQAGRRTGLGSQAHHTPARPCSIDTWNDRHCPNHTASPQVCKAAPAVAGGDEGHAGCWREAGRRWPGHAAPHRPGRPGGPAKQHNCRRGCAPAGSGLATAPRSRFVDMRTGQTKNHATSEGAAAADRGGHRAAGMARGVRKPSISTADLQQPAHDH